MAETTRLPEPLDVHWDWQRRAACRSLPESLFFHPDGERDPRRSRRVDRAKQICARCPVRGPCFSHSLSAEEPYGTWGGVDERERVAILRRRRGARTAAGGHYRPAGRDDAAGA
ncbi:WhiB family transcriptional regulator [Actinomycetospora endophytica]|uniref:Transcriptional regulator WhiB n=1 Tax=Actinomycetospora endophytica TaxID=2291215 RepID=A0ABS8P1A0_9PSEU|nr:WhiB family transcriptional regulator [Actinomycetospora endophytica]MCD2191869.1 WhiB family transcriptional regulator [Actinomycetospora endophytica]